MSRILKPKKPYLQGGHPLNRGLIAAWPMTEGGGNNLFDILGRNNIVTFIGSPLPVWSAGRAGPALTFTSADYYGAVTTKVISGASFTLSVWFNAVGTVQYNSLMTSYGSSYFLLDIYSTSGAFWSSDGLTGDTLGVSFTANLWNHLVLTRAGNGITGGYAAYLNGWQKGTGNTGTLALTVPWTIGSRIGFSQTMDGQLDDIRIYNRALSAAEVLALYQTTYAEFTPNFRAKLKHIKAASATTFLPAWATGCNQTFGGQASP